MKNTVAMGIRRFFAFLIDWNLSGVPAILLSLLITNNDKDMFLRPSVSDMGFLLLFFIAFLSFPALILFRDIIFGGRSIGKRLFGLVAINKNDLSKVSSSKTLLRNLFSFIFPADGIVYLICGETLGDKVSRTAVISKKDYESGIYSPPTLEPKQFKKRLLTVIITLTALFFTLMVVLSITMFNSIKNQESYKIAESYIVTSEKYSKIIDDSSAILVTGCSSYEKYDKETNSTTYETKFTFLVKGRSVKVTCHKTNNEWYVCEDCTDFK